MTLEFKVGDEVEAFGYWGTYGHSTWSRGRIARTDDSDPEVPYLVAADDEQSIWCEPHEVRAIAQDNVRHDGKADTGKPPWQLLPWEALAGVVDVLAYGAKTYGENTWQTVPNGQERYLGAMLRHIAAWKGGEANDRESGLPHLAHVATNALFLLALGAKR